ncbi:MAG: hypothetical protein ABFS10_07345 [Bacteroidota bacterium]
MKVKIFLSAVLVVLLVSCGKEEYMPHEYIGDVVIDDAQDMVFLQKFDKEGYNTIRGNLTIDNVPDMDLSLLSDIVEIYGNLTINNEYLTSLEFLSKLERVSNLSLNNLLELQVSDFSKLELVEGRVSIRSLINFEGDIVFPRLTSIGSSITINYSGGTISFPAVTSRLNKVSLERLSGEFSNDFLPLVNEVDYISMIRCDSMKNLSGFRSLKSTGELLMWGNHAISDLSGLENLQSVERLRLIDNFGLRSLDGLENLSLISEQLQIADNGYLNDLCALAPEAIPSISSQAMIEYQVFGNLWNPTLENLQDGYCVYTY